MKLIIAVNNKNVIGKDGELPWRCKADLQHFKKLTMGCKLLVGRTTFEKLPPLPGRELIVVGTGYYTMAQALDLNPDWVIGGASIYGQLIDMCDEIHMSHIGDDSNGDAFFDIDEHRLMPGVIIHYNRFEADKPKDDVKTNN